MPLESIGSLIQRALRGEYVVGYFESWNIESLQGVIDAAEQTRSPIIVGFNGGFLRVCSIIGRPFSTRLGDNLKTRLFSAAG